MEFGFEVELEDGGNAGFRIVPPARQAPDAPLVTFARDAASGAAAALIGQLCYLDALPLAAAGRSDAAIALEMFRMHGAAGLQRLEGDFALVLFDPAERRLIAQRDPLGAWPLYTGGSAGSIRIGTSLLSLAAAEPQAGVDPAGLGRYLMSACAFVEPATGRTIFKGLDRVRPGSQLELRPGAAPRLLWRHEWRWQAPDAVLAGIDPRDAHQEYGRLLRRAVEERIARGRPAAHLSGGMDSSALVRLARDALACEGQGRRLTTLSLVYEMASLAPEREYIELVLRERGPLEPHLEPGDRLLGFDWFERAVPAHDEPYPGLFYLGAERGLAERAAALGATGVLTGTGAESSVEGTHLHLADLLRRGRLGATVAEARRWALARNQSLASVFWQMAAAPNLPPALRGGLRGLVNGGYGRWPGLGGAGIPPWIRAGFAKDHDLRGIGRELAADLWRYPIEASTQRVGLAAMAGAWSAWYLAGPRGVHTARPFLDPRLLDFALRLPREVREVPGTAKPLLAGAMRGILPEPIRTRVHKRSFNDVFFMGLARQGRRLETMVRDADVDAIVDKGCLLRCLREHAHGIGHVQGGNRIATTLSLILWLEHLPRWRRPLAGGVVHRTAGTTRSLAA